MKHLLLHIVLVFAVLGAWAQPPMVAIRGRVTDRKTGEEVAYATVCLRSKADSTVVAGEITDSLGYYRLRPVPRGCYFLEFTHLTYKTLRVDLPENPDTEVWNACLDPDVNRIKAVAIVAQFISHRAGGYVVSMVGNPLSKEPSMIHVLEMLPGMRRDPEGGFRINGREIKAISVDDRDVSPEELDALSAERVETIEVKNFASGTQDVAERGAVLEITLRPMKKDAFYSSIQSNVGLWKRGMSRFEVLVPMAVRHDKMNVYNYFSYKYKDELDEYAKHADYAPQNPIPMILSEEEDRTHHHTLTDRLNLVFDLAPRHRLGITGLMSYASSAPDFFSRSDHFAEGATDPQRRSHYRSEGSLDNYVWQVAGDYHWKTDDRGSELAVTMDYLASCTRKSYVYSDWKTSSSVAEREVERMKPRSQAFAAEAALAQVFADNLSLESGIFYYHNEERHKSLMGAEGVEPEVATFHYRGDGAAIYSECEFATERVQLLGGVRVQWDRVNHFTGGDTRWRKKDYWRFCPNLTLALLLGADRRTTLDLDYTRADGEIPYTQLSPIKVQQSEFRYRVGNPMLMPPTGYELGATLTLREKWVFAYRFIRGRDLIQTLTLIDPDDPQRVYERPENCASSSLHLVAVSYAAPLTPWWRVNWEVDAAHRSEHYVDSGFDAYQFEAFLNNTFRISANMGVKLMAHLASREREFEWRRNSTYEINAMIYRYFLKRRLYVSLGCRGILNHNSIEHTWNFGERYFEVARHRAHRIYTFSLSYSFNKLKGSSASGRSAGLQKFTNIYE